MIIVIYILPFIFNTAQAICTAVSVWLVCDQLYLCFILRPTSNADEITYLTYKRFPHHVHWRLFFYPLKRFPEISVCPVPPYNITKLTQKGYPSLFYYYLGLKDDDNFIGWGGEHQGDSLELLGNVTTIADNIVVNSLGTNVVDETFYAVGYTANSYKLIPAEIQVIELWPFATLKHR